MTGTWWAVPVGLAFGFALDQAGLTRQAPVVGVFRFRDWTVVKFLLSGLTAGALLVQGALALHLITSIPVPPTRLVANLAGGAIFGAAMASAGFCSGTILAAVTSGRRQVAPALLGLLAGGFLGDIWDRPITALRAFGPALTESLPVWLGVNGWYVVALLLEIAVFVVYAIERGRVPRLLTAPRSSRPRQSSWSER